MSSKYVLLFIGTNTHNHEWYAMPPKRKKGLTKSKSQPRRLQEEVDDQPDVATENQPEMATAIEVAKLHQMIQQQAK